MPVISRYETVEKTTGWKSPGQVRMGNQYGRHDWLNIHNLKYWDDITYAICEDGVTDEISSQNLYFYDFGLEVPSNANITNVSIRIKCLNDTIGGGEITDELLRLRNNNNSDDGLNTDNNSVNNKFWETGAIENIYKKNDWLTEDLTPADVALSDFGFVYRVKGTSEHSCIPFIYGVQVKVDYTVYEETEYYKEAHYEITASLPDYVFTSIGQSKTLTINTKVLNGVSGVLGNIYITLSDELKFSTGTQTIVIEAQNTDENFNKTTNFTVQSVKYGIGSITIKSGSLTTPLKLTVLVDTENTFLDKLVNITGCNFINNHVSVRGGGYFNANNIITSDNTFQDNSADVFGDDYYDSRTVINFNPASSYEIGKTARLEIFVELNDPNLEDEEINTGLITIYEDTTEIGSANVISGKAVFNYTPSNVGQTLLSFTYNGSPGLYSKSELDKEITVTKKNTNFIGGVDFITQGDYYECVLVDSDNNPLANQSVTLRINGVDYPRVTTEEGETWLQINLLHNTYEMTMIYTGNDTYNACTVKRELNVIKKPVQLVTENMVEQKDNILVFKVVLADIDGFAIPNQQLTIKLVDSEDSVATYSKITDSSGETFISPALDVDVYAVTVEYEGSDLYEALTVENYLIITEEGYQDCKLELISSEITTTVNNDFSISGRLNPYYNQQPLRLLIFDEDNLIVSDVKASTQTQGQFSISSKLTEIGDYTFYILFAGDNFGNYAIEKGTINVGNTGAIKTIFQASNYKAKINEPNNRYYVRLLDVDSNPLSGKSVHYKISVNNTFKEYIGTTDENGYSYYPIELLGGVYSVIVSFLGDSQYSSTTTKRTITITNTGFQDTVLSRVIANGYPPYYGDANSPFFWSLKTTDNQVVGGKITYLSMHNLTTENVDVVQRTTFYQGGIGTYNFTYPPGIYLFCVDFVGDANYNSSHLEELLVLQGEGSINTFITGQNINIYEGQIVDYKLVFTDSRKNNLPNKSIVTVVTDSNGGKDYLLNTTDDNGEIYINIDYSTGVYTLTNYFAGDDAYANSSSSNTIIVNQPVQKNATRIIGNDVTFETTEPQKFKVTLLNQNGNPLSGKKISFKIDETNYSANTTSDGVASLNLNLIKGEHIVNYSFDGDSTYALSNGTSKITIVEKVYAKTSIEAYDTRVEYNKGSIVAILKNENIPLNGKSLTFVLIDENNQQKSQRVVTNNNGEAILSLSNIYVGDYTCLVIFNGDNTYSASSNEIDLTILPPASLQEITLEALNVEMDYGDGESFTVSGTNANVNGQYLKVKLNRTDGIVYEFTQVFEDGTVTIPLIDLPAGKYNVIATYPVQSVYNEAMITATITINKRELSATATSDETTFKLNVHDEDGRDVANHYVIITVGNKNYTKVTDLEGNVTVTLENLNDDETVSYQVVSTENYIGTKGTF